MRKLLIMAAMVLAMAVTFGCKKAEEPAPAPVAAPVPEAAPAPETAPAPEAAPAAPAPAGH
ncbi:MAG: hypothetical protein Q7T53_11850 [Deltaproteobacteria bacterium]|nr:hypothetical protein [Deltaproteobacteria bacterium]